MKSLIEDQMKTGGPVSALDLSVAVVIFLFVCKWFCRSLRIKSNNTVSQSALNVKKCATGEMRGKIARVLYLTGQEITPFLLAMQLLY